jgi:hypothetical protein
VKRPIDQFGGDKRAVTWKADAFAASFEAGVSRALHRYAGQRYSLSTFPKRSAIDKRYFAEISRYAGNGYMHNNIALGTGSDPVAAALQGYRFAQPNDPMWQVFELEHEVDLLRRALVRRREFERKLERVIDNLTATLRSFNVPA